MCSKIPIKRLVRLLSLNTLLTQELASKFWKVIFYFRKEILSIFHIRSPFNLFNEKSILIFKKKTILFTCLYKKNPSVNWLIPGKKCFEKHRIFYINFSHQINKRSSKGRLAKKEKKLFE